MGSLMMFGSGVYKPWGWCSTWGRRSLEVSNVMIQLFKNQWGSILVIDFLCLLVAMLTSCVHYFLWVLFLVIWNKVFCGCLQSLNFFSLRLLSFVIDCSCIVPLTLVAIVIRGTTIHPLACLSMKHVCCASCEQCFWISVMVVCEFYELYCEWLGGG